MNCLFCDDKIVDASLLGDVYVSKNCEFSYSTFGSRIFYYVCVNRRIVIVNNGWLDPVKKTFFTVGTFISYKPPIRNVFTWITDRF